ncbi:MAG: VCBS repeat-containing protein [Anaeromyxobacter sp.]|nr:VCBS repeat-containing protein [Anaeromyxobacter sp.]
MTELLLALALGAGALSNFPADAGGAITHPAVGVLLDGAPVVVVVAGEQLTAFRFDGTPPAGLPLSLGGGEVAVGAPAAADMDGDRRPEVAVVTASGKVVLWSAGGRTAGWPVALGARAKAGAAFADVDGDGKPELVVGDDRGRLHALERSGAEAHGFPVQLGRAAVTASPASAVFAGGLSLAVGCEDGKVHVVNGAGRPRPGFPLSTAFAVTGAPAFADLDDDGALDLVVASQDFKLHAVSAAGAPLPGFPVAAGYRLYEGPALADLDGDHHLDVVFASADGQLHAVDRLGKPLAGFPVKAGGRTFGGPAVGDLDRDGRLDVVVACSDGSVAAVNAAGRALPGFPGSLGEPEVTASPLLLDLAGDGSLSVFVGTPSGQLHALRAARVASPVAGPAAAPWPGPGRDAARAGRFGPNPPTYKDLSVAPPAPRRSDALVASWRGVWLDAAPGAGAPAPRLSWLRDGQVVAALDGKREVPAGTLRRGERWRFEASSPPGAGEGLTAASPEVVVQDTAPTTPELRMEPAVPVRGTPVRAVLVKASTDLDGDALRYAYDWLLDGLETGVTGETFPGDRLRSGLLLTARVVASDGTLAAPAASADGRVANTAPGAPEVALEPAQPRVTDAVTVQLVRPAVDPDGDQLAYRQRWLVDGKPLALPASATEAPAGLVRKHRRLQVEVRAFDGAAEGPAALAEVLVLDTAPAAPRVEIRPARPRRGEPLRATLVAPAEDADGDALTHAFTWTKNGAPLVVPGDGREVAGAEVARGDRFEVSVRASDGEQTGPAGSALVTVVNTPPEPPRVAIEPRHPRGGEPLRLVVVQPARDADGDAVKLSLGWTREGKTTGTSAEVLAPAGFRKHERVRLIVTPGDGQEAGVPATDEVVVENAPPGAPVVAFEQARPVVTAPLTVLVKTPAADPDGDAVRYRYRWRRNGALVQLLGKDAAQDPEWTEANQAPAALLTKGDRWEVEVQAFDGEVHGPAGSAAVTVANSPPAAPRPSFRPGHARRVDGLTVELAQAPDADGDHLDHRYTWTRDGQRVEAPPGQALVARGTPRRGERWAVEVVAFDGEAESPPGRVELVVADTAPGPVSIALCDGPVQSGLVPEVRVVAAASDADGDGLSYRHAWTLNGKPVAGATSARFPRALGKHDVAEVQVTPWDGELAGPTATATCRARNTPPTAPVAVFEPAAPTALTGLSVRLTRAATDHDGDQVAYRYRWSRDGLPFQLDGPSAPPRTLRHREAWRVEVVPTDGEAEGAPVVLTAEVANTPPPVPAAVVKPLVPTVGQLLTCETTVPERDADHEAVTVRYRWLVDDQPQPLAEGSPVLPAQVVRRGQRWRCEAWSSDGLAESARAVAEVKVQNSPPGSPLLAIEPDPARTADDLACRVAVPAVDPDGDEVGYTISWWRNERPLLPGADSSRLPASATSRGDRFRCAATPSDGTLPGPAASVERTIANSPPGPARVRVTPATPQAGQPLRCEVVGKAEDPDSDAVRYRHRWQRNGTAQPFSETTDEVAGRMVRAGDRWRCLVVPSDGDMDGPDSGSEEVEIRNIP